MLVIQFLLVFMYRLGNVTATYWQSLITKWGGASSCWTISYHWKIWVFWITICFTKSWHVVILWFSIVFLIAFNEKRAWHVLYQYLFNLFHSQFTLKNDNLIFTSIYKISRINMRASLLHNPIGLFRFYLDLFWFNKISFINEQNIEKTFIE